MANIQHMCALDGWRCSKSPYIQIYIYIAVIQVVSLHNNRVVILISQFRAAIFSQVFLFKDRNFYSGINFVEVMMVKRV